VVSVGAGAGVAVGVGEGASDGVADADASGVVDTSGVTVGEAESEAAGSDGETEGSGVEVGTIASVDGVGEAIRVPPDKLEENLPRIPKNRPVVAYCT
jgi:hypothetical protein